MELTAIQKKYYRAILEKNLKYLCKGTNMPTLNNISMELRKCCNHPFLIDGMSAAIPHQSSAHFRLELRVHPTLDEQ